MIESITHLATRVPAPAGNIYRVATWGEPQPDGTWTGGLVFEPLDIGHRVRRTKTETNQPDGEALAYWATGLALVDLKEALSRAQ
jgi:hypothetical protein